jgi:hypothetical protein
LCNATAFAEHKQVETVGQWQQPDNLPDEAKRDGIDVMALAAKVERLYRAFFNRPPEQQELGDALNLLVDFSTQTSWHLFDHDWQLVDGAWAAPAVGAVIRRQDLLDQRAQVSALANKFGFPSPTFTDPNIMVGETPIKAIHVSELREWVDRIYAQAGRKALWTSDVARPGQAPQALQWQEIQEAVTFLNTINPDFDPSAPTVQWVRAALSGVPRCCGAPLYYTRALFDDPVPFQQFNLNMKRTILGAIRQELRDRGIKNIQGEAAVIALGAAAQLGELGTFLFKFGLPDILAGLRAGTIAVELSTFFGATVVTLTGAAMLAIALLAFTIFVVALIGDPNPNELAFSCDLSNKFISGRDSRGRLIVVERWGTYDVVMLR